MNQWNKVLITYSVFITFFIIDLLPSIKRIKYTPVVAEHKAQIALKDQAD